MRSLGAVRFSFFIFLFFVFLGCFLELRQCVQLVKATEDAQEVSLEM